MITHSLFFQVPKCFEKTLVGGNQLPKLAVVEPKSGKLGFLRHFLLRFSDKRRYPSGDPLAMAVTHGEKDER